MSWLPPAIIAVPAIAALLGLAVHRTPVAARATAVAAAAIVTVLSGIELASPARSATIASIGPLSAGELDVPLHLLSDRLSGLVSLTVALVVVAVQAYSTWYLTDDRRQGVFLAAVSLFSAGMLLVVHSADLLLTLVGWEVMGWCSWLLIGHHTERASARRAAYKAFLVTRAADIGMVIGLVALAARAGSTDLLTVLQNPTRGALLTVGLVGVLVGVAGKSGLVPFHDWLPDAMEGPSPASALIHAATMVAAGTYVVARLFSLFATHEGARWLLAVLAAATMLYAAALAFVQSDLKRLLAYSTLSQVALMLAALAAAPLADGPGAGIGHLVGHAYFKALLFLAAGWVAAVAGGTALTAVRGRIGASPVLAWAFRLGLAALAGLPPTIGFFTKDGVLGAALDGAGNSAAEGGSTARSLLVLLAGLATVVLTAAYCTRVWMLLEPGPQRAEQAAAPRQDEHAPLSTFALGAVALLMALTLLGTFLLPLVQGGLHLDPFLGLLSVVLVVAMAVLVRRASRKTGDAADSLAPQRIRGLGERGFGADRAYTALGQGVLALARGAASLERDVVDAYPRAMAVLARVGGRGLEGTHRAVPSTALLGVLVGMFAVAAVGWLSWR